MRARRDSGAAPSRLQNAAPSSRAWLLAAVLLTLLWFAALDMRKLHHPDEGRYAEIAREMLQSGDWVTPRLDGLKYFEKPPLQYWLAAGAFAIFGVHDWSARLPSALFGWLAVIAVGYAGARIADVTTGLFAAGALAACVWQIGIAHFLTLDAMLSGWLALALAAFLVAQSAATTLASRRRWMLGAWVAVAGAVLTKGPIGLVIPAGALALHSLAARDWAVWRRLAWLPGIAVVLLLCAPWFVAVSSRNPEFARFFFIHEHVERFLTTEHRREGAWWYFVPLLIVGLLPWTGLLLKMPAAWRDATRGVNGFAWVRFCLAWALFVFLFFSVSGSKLPSYILPLFPALALVIGWVLARMSSAWWRWLLGSIAVGSSVAAVGLWLGFDRLAQRLATDRTPAEVYVSFGQSLKAGTTLFAIAAVASCLAERRGTVAARGLAIVLLALGMNLAMQLGFWANDGLSPSRSTAGLVTALEAAPGTPYDARAPFFQVRLYDQTLPWYLRRTTTVVDYRDELALGLDAEPGKGIADTHTWIARWNSLPQAYALMTPETYEELRRDGVPMRIAARSARYVIAARQ
jgi:4-amino-4-deoxy-L-arabinose transferase-like glycosyltransferase